ncbi:type I secretion system permease/ATPase [Parendozoicomonas haliclonae]|uniref:Toxin RTX-I translocation ATP-binding protein n=1 Tax=Parendozoicomonas haliclonae TaxID=1960125 RepID=A0A1X7ARK5_9GAMM|nr:type I secretion system permease/ATPase [Parendozoicomonas haliclonae]SMA50037.1 Toxin RTX-I translocation ATP-binding protein [Parendozoicomonas haliclonae]
MQGQEKQKFSWFWEAVKPYWRVYRDVLLASLLINIFALVSPLFVMNVYDRVVPNQAFETLWMLTAGVILAFVLEFVIRLMRTRYTDLAGRQIDLTLSSRLIDRLLGLKLSSRPGGTGTLMNSVAEFDSIRSFITSSSVLAIIDLPFVLLFLALILWVGGWMVLIPLGCIVLSLLVAWVLNTPMQKVIFEQQDASAQRQNYLMEMLFSLVSVKTSNTQQQNQVKWSELNQTTADLGLKIRALQMISSQSTTLFMQLNTVLLVVVGVYLISSGDLSMGGLIAMMMISGRCAAPVAQVIGLLNQYEKAVHALEHAGNIMNLPQESPDDRQLLKPEVFQGHWQINQVSFNYPDSSPSLSNINLTIEHGQKVAVLGRIGSGKTTLLQLLSGLWEPVSGNISLNYLDMRQIEPSWLRSYVGYVPQKSELFNTTLRENITMGRAELDDNDVLWALEKSGLAGIVQTGSAGLDFQVGENGRHLSGGQAQAVSLARALVTRPKALLLDEPTSAMDSHAEARFIQLLGELDDVTVVVVTHKMSLLGAMDKIVVLDQGAIKVQGSARDIMSQMSSAGRSQPAVEEAVN